MNELLTRLAQAGIRLRLVDDALQVSGRPHALTPDLRDALREHRQSLLTLLRHRHAAAATPVRSAALTLAPVERHLPFPLTDVQHAYWLGRRDGIELGGVSTHFYFEIDAQGLDLPRFEWAWQRLIERHDMLRAIVQPDGQQRILAQVPAYRVAVDDASALERAAAQARLDGTRQAMSHAVHPADRWPVFDVRATRLPGDGLRLHFSLDMLLMDGASLFILFDEWQQLVQRPDAALPALELGFRDCVLAEQALRSGPSYALAQRYWTTRLATLPPAPALPLRSAAAAQDVPPRFTRRRAHVDGARWSRLKARARDAGLTASGLLLAVYAEVLTRWSTTAHYTLNLTLLNRPALHPQVAALIGDFTSLSLLEVDHRETGTTFAGRAAVLQRQLMADLEHHAYSGVQVLRGWMQHHRHPPLQAAMPVVFTSGLVLGDGSGHDAALVECFGPMVYGVSQTPQVWLDHQVMEVRGELVFNWDAVEALFEPGILDAMFEAQRTLLHRLADDEACWQRTAPLCEPACLLPAAPAHTPSLLHAGVLAHARRTPDAPAVITATRTLSYRTLLAEGMAVARWLRSQGLQRGQLVGVLMHKGWEQVVAALGTLLAGGAYLPIDASLPVARQEELLSIGEAACVLVQADPADGNRADTGPARGRRCHAVRRLPEAEAPPPLDADALDAQSQHPADLAYVIFTSGTTGQPKGVMISHRAAWNTIAAVNAMLQLGPQDRVLGVSSLGFDLSVYDLFGSFAAGAALVLPDAARQRDAAHWCGLMARHRVSVWNSAPQLMGMLAGAVDDAEVPPAPTLRAVLLSGDWIPVDLPARLQRLWPMAQQYSLGGATEASIWSICHPIGQVDPSWTSIPYGHALPGQTVTVRNARLQTCPAQVRGRLFIGGAGLADGYWQDAARTAQQFITCPDTGERLYDTGDLGRYLADGQIELLGREDAQVKIRGHRVEPGEVTAVLREHPDVQAAAVRAVGTRAQRRLVAYVQLADGPLASLGRQLRAEPPPVGVLLDQLQPPPGLRPLTAELRGLWSMLDDYHLAAVVGALRRFGFGAAGGTLSVPGLLALGVAPRYQRWLLRAFETLAAAGLLRQDGPVHRIDHDWQEPDLAGLSLEIADMLSRTLNFEPTETLWLISAAERLQAVLTERVHSAEVYAADATERLYQRLFPDSHAQLAQVMRALQQGAQHGTPGLSIIELGAGWGSATRHLLPLLRGQDRYLFTDISEFFLQRARRLWGEEHPGLAFTRCDADLRPEWQGLPRHAFDVVLAASMLHDVRDVRAALDNISALLKPGGHLVLLEQTRFWPSFDLHMGLQQGFDVATDTGLRPRHALLTVPQWQMLLGEAGFTQVQVLQAPGTAIEHLGFHVIVATGALQTGMLDEQAVRAYLRSRLPEPLVPTQVVQVKRFPLSANGKLDLQALPEPPDEANPETPDTTAPRTETERLVQACWSAALPGREVALFDDFFDIGGDSLVATQVVREIGSRCGCTVEIHELLAHKTVAGLAALIDAKRAAAAATDTGADEGVEPAALPAASVFRALSEPPERLITEVDRLAAQLPAQEPAAAALDLHQARAVLLTGATGWLGAYLLRELLARTSAEIVCPVRAPDAATAMERIKRNVASQGIALGFGWEARVRAQPAQIGAARCGVDDTTWRGWCEGIDHIFHAAASIDVLADYGTVRGVNVEAVQQLALLARQHHGKPIVFPSSHAVCLRHAGGVLVAEPNEVLLPSAEGLLNGYAQSKWVAEQLLARAASARTPVKILRIPHVVPATDGMLYPTGGMLHSILTLSRMVGTLPDWPDSHVDAVPVDLLATLMVDAARWPEPITLSLVAPLAPPSLPEVARCALAGSGLPRPATVPLGHWVAQCRQALRQGSIPPQAAVLSRQLLAPTESGAILHALFGPCAVAAAHFAGQPAAQRLAAMDWQAYWTRLGGHAF